MAGPEPSASPAGGVAPAAVGEAALPTWLNPSVRWLGRVAVVMTLTWLLAWCLQALSPAESWLQSVWLQYPLMLMWVSLAAYLAVMAWRLLWQSARPGVMVAWLALAWLSVLVHVFVGLATIRSLDAVAELLAEPTQPNVQAMQAGALELDLPVDRRELAARIVYRELGARVAWRNAQGEVQAFEPTAKDQADWRTTQALAQTHRQMPQQWREMRAQVIWAVTWVLGLFVAVQLLIAATLARVRSRTTPASPATSAPSAQG